MRLMGLEAIYPKPKLSAGGPRAPDLPVFAAEREHRAARPGVEHGHHLRAAGRGVHVPGGDHRLVQPLCHRLAAVEHAGRLVLPGDAGGGVERGRPEVFNTDQGVQFTAQAWTGRLESAGVAVSMDGRGRCLDNVFVERLWRTVKYEDIYLRRLRGGAAVAAGAGAVLPVLQRGAAAPVAGATGHPAEVYRARRAKGRRAGRKRASGWFATAVPRAQ